jgi:hypothetical protein
MSMVFIVITVDNTEKANVLRFRDYIFIMIFNDKPVISSRAGKNDKKMLTFLEHLCSKTAGTLLVVNTIVIIPLCLFEPG